MRSGTNHFHGSAYDYWVNEALNSAGAYSHTRPKIRKNDFGGTIGGPVWIPKIYNGKDKTFFFFSFESLPTTTTNLQQPAHGSHGAISGREFQRGSGGDRQ